MAAGGPVVPPPGSLISIVTPSIKDQEHTIEHAVKKEYSCITSNLVRSRIPNPKKCTKDSIHIYVDLYEKTDGQTDEQTDGQMKRQTEIRTEEQVSLLVRSYVRPTLLSSASWLHLCLNETLIIYKLTGVRTTGVKPSMSSSA